MIKDDTDNPWAVMICLDGKDDWIFVTEDKESCDWELKPVLFKDINDKYGHLFGDEVLQHICFVCNEEIRSIDFFARYGGEEFIILLPESELSGAIATAERIQSSLAKQTITLEGVDVYVTLSIGICQAEKRHGCFEDVIKDADAAMYKAKENGRNRIEVCHNE